MSLYDRRRRQASGTTDFLSWKEFTLVPRSALLQFQNAMGHHKHTHTKRWRQKRRKLPRTSALPPPREAHGWGSEWEHRNRQRMKRNAIGKGKVTKVKELTSFGNLLVFEANSEETLGAREVQEVSIQLRLQHSRVLVTTSDLRLQPLEIIAILRSNPRVQ